MSTEPTLKSTANAHRARLRQKVREGLARLRQRIGDGLAPLVAGRPPELAGRHDVDELTKITARLTELYEELTLMRDENREDHVQLYLAAFGLIDAPQLGEEDDAPGPWESN
jgi:hypothetical protein